jgi:hypothetical protein
MPPSNGAASTALSESEQLALKEVQVNQYAETLVLLSERLAELELALEDTGWMRMTIAGEREFSREGLRKLCRIARLSFLKNPLINHACRIQANYVWAQGAAIHSPNEQVNALIQKFMDDRKNKLELTGHQSRTLKEIELQVHGNLFVALYTNPSTGRVLLKAIPMDEIVDIITSPDDSSEPWFYKRAWTMQEFDPTQENLGPVEQKYAFHPDWQYAYHTEYERPTMIGEWPVMWDAPVYHVRAGGFSDQRFGVPEIYSALDWAKAVKSDLEDYATIRRALARFAWNLTVKGGKAGVAAAKAKFGTNLNSDGAGQMETNPSPVTASTFVAAEGATMAPMKTAGAAPSPDEGRRLWLMVAAGTGIPETILSGDADVGNLATAKTLDRPTELQMRSRQTLWADIYLDILNYVVDQAALAPKGPLAGTATVDEYTEERVVTLDVDPETNEPAARTIDITFPNILQRDALPTVQAIVQAATLNGGQTAGLIDDRTLAKLLLSALGEDDIDMRLQELFPDNSITTLAGKDLPDDTKDPDSPGPMLPKAGFGPGPIDDAGGTGAPNPPPMSTYPSKGTEAQAEFREVLGLFRRMMYNMTVLPESADGD